MSVLLSIKDVRKQFGGLRAVDGVSFDVRSGEVIGLLGPNGSGKTTLLNLISGALTPTAGVINLEGQNIAGLRPDQVARCGVARTFQLVRLLPTLSILDNVAIAAMFGAKQMSRQEADDLARACLKAVGLHVDPNMSAGELTYIDQKRAELARALTAEPKLLLLDEWLSGLNPTELKEGISLIQGLAASGVTVILVEHIMAAVRALCSRVVVMAAGQRIADGPTELTLKEPRVVSAYLGGDDA